MSISTSIRSQFAPVHPEGYPFVAGFAIATAVLFWLWSPAGWLAVFATLWCAYFFRDPQRAARSHLDFHERLRLSREPQSGDRPGRADRLS
jgi:phosphatidylserine decarboxylase